jgi:hypothetical protein
MRLPGGNYSLDPGDQIVSVGGVECSTSEMTLQELLDQAYQNGERYIMVRDVNTGELVRVELPEPDDGDSGNESSEEPGEP